MFEADFSKPKKGCCFNKVMKSSSFAFKLFISWVICSIFPASLNFGINKFKKSNELLECYGEILFYLHKLFNATNYNITKLIMLLSTLMKRELLFITQS